MLKAFRLLLLTLGVALGAYLIYANAGAIGDAFGRVGFRGICLYLAASSVAHVLNAWAWRLVFVEGQPHAGFWRLFSARLAGEAVNKVTPLASVGGEPVKAYLLARHGGSLPDALASVAIAKNAMTLAQIAYIFCGVALALQIRPDREQLILGLGAFPALILLAMLITAVLDYRLRRRGSAKGRSQDNPVGSCSSSNSSSSPNRLTSLRAGPKSPEPAADAPKAGAMRRALLAGRQAAVKMWARVADFYWTRPGASAAAFVLLFLGWAGGALELLAGTYALGFPLSPRDAFALEALLCSVNMATFFIPANAGAQEGGYALLAPLVGLGTPHGVALAVLRRCRDVVWIGFGLAYLSLTEGRVLLGPRLESSETAG